MSPHLNARTSSVSSAASEVSITSGEHVEPVRARSKTPKLNVSVASLCPMRPSVNTENTGYTTPMISEIPPVTTVAMDTSPVPAEHAVLIPSMGHAVMADPRLSDPMLSQHAAGIEVKVKADMAVSDEPPESPPMFTDSEDGHSEAPAIEPELLEMEEPAEAATPDPLRQVNGGVKKRKNRARLTQPKKTKKEYRPKKDAIEKMLREEADTEGFLLSGLDWTNWKQAIRRKHPKMESWEPRPGSHVGARRRQLYEDMDLPAVYEVAVQCPESKAKIPVFTSVTRGIAKGNWESTLLSKPKVKAQVDRVLRRNCKLYVRRAPFAANDLPDVYKKCDMERTSSGKVSTVEALNELRGLMTKVCDYAWKDHYDIDSRTYSHRGLIVEGVKVSD